MAKSTKHQDKVGTFEDFKAPWETESGEDAEIEKSKLKRFIYNLKFGEAKALDEKSDAAEAQAAAETERDEAKEAAANANPAEAQKTIDKLTTERDNLKAERDGLVKDKERNDLRAKVLEGVDPKVAKYVVGETEEELEESLKAVKEDFGISDEPNEDDEEEETTGRTTPVVKRNLRNPADGSKGGDDTVIDYDAEVDKMLGSGPFR